LKGAKSRTAIITTPNLLQIQQVAQPNNSSEAKGLEVSEDALNWSKISMLTNNSGKIKQQQVPSNLLSCNTEAPELVDQSKQQTTKRKPKLIS
jgi:hypothetical protein